MLSKMSQLSEATKKTKTGIQHTADKGGYGRKEIEDEPKKKRGGQEKDDGPKFDTPKGDIFGRTSGKAPEGKPGKKVTPMADADKAEKKAEKAEKKKGLKEWMKQLESALIEGEVTKTKTGLKHKGTYGTSYETDEEGNEKNSSEKKGRGRPSKESEKKFDTSNLGKALKEADQLQIRPASMVPKKPGQMGQQQSQQPGQQPGQPQQNTQVITQGDKTLGTVNNPQLASTIKQAIGQGQMTLNPDEQLAELSNDTLNSYRDKVHGDIAKKWNAGDMDKVSSRLQGTAKASRRIAGVKPQGVKESGNWIKGAIEKPGAFSAKAKRAGETTSQYAKEKAHAPGKLGKEARLAQTLSKMRHKKTNEAERPSLDSVEGAGLGGGRSDNFLEGKRNVKESMDNRLKAAHHAGRAHGLTGHAHCGNNYDDMEEARVYHEGYKQGLDECYGQMPIQGYVGENNYEVDDMASFGAHTPAMEDEMDEGNAFTRELAKTPAGGTFSLGGKKYKDTSGYDSSVFESWDNQLGALLMDEYNTIQEGLSVSISKGQEGAPDSVSVTAQDGEADQLLQFIKQAGLGIFGGEEPEIGASSPMSQAADGEPTEIGANGAEIDVVDDHGNMMDLIRKVTGGEKHTGPEQGFGDEEHEHADDEEECDECGMAECECGSPEEGEEQVDEVESEDQMEFNVAENNAPDSGAADTELENNDDQEANQSASTYDQAEDSQEAASDSAEGNDDEEEEETVEESLANGTDDTFESDIDFMTKVISGGLNKQKSTGQTTIPVIAHQGQRTGVTESKMLNESVADWKKLAGIK